MHSVLKDICASLDQTAVRIKGLGISQTLRDSWGWQFPPLSKDDLAGIATSLADRIREADVEDLDNEFVSRIAVVPARLQAMWGETIPNIAGNFPAAYSYMMTIDTLEKALAPILTMTVVNNPKLLPAKTANRLKAVNRTMGRIDEDLDGLTQRVREINQAHAAALNLSTTLQELEEARIALDEIRGKVEKVYEDAAKTQGKIEDNEKKADAELVQMKASAAKADELIERCEQAYQITTTKGLAGAFDQRAMRLNLSIVAWVIGLLIALYFGADIGSKRIDALTKLLAVDHDLHWGVVIIHTVLAVLSVGGPLWFGWLATKQIGQRFRLAEDYAFKASVAKAYEGYRKQAANFDESLSARLFGAALTRLEEAPLRLVEKDAHGSPWHELMSSEAFKKAMSSVPEFQDKVLDLARKSLDTVAAVASSRAKSKEAIDSAALKD